jgi:hypothetical protein
MIINEWDIERGIQVDRDATPEEVEDFNTQISIEFQNQKAIYLDFVRVKRSAILDRLNGHATRLLLDGVSDSDPKSVNCKSVIEDLLNITAIQSSLSATNLDDFCNAIRAEFQRIIGICDTDFIKAFRGINI